MKNGIFLAIFAFFVPAVVCQTLADAKAWYKSGEYKRAAPVFESEIRKNKTHAEANYYLGMIALRNEKDYEKAVDFLERACESDRLNALYFFGLGQAYGAKAQNSNFAMQLILAPKIKSAFEKAVEFDGTMIDAREGLLRFYMIAPGILGGSMSKAREQAEIMLRMDPFRGYMALITLADYENDVTSMEAYVSKASSLNPKSTVPFNRLGYLYLRKNRVDDALAQFRKMVSADPDEANSYDSLGDGYVAKNSLDEAIEAYKKALEKDPKFAVSAYNLGLCFEKKGMKTESAKYFQLYLQIDPEGRYARSARERIKP